MLSRLTNTFNTATEAIYGLRSCQSHRMAESPLQFESDDHKAILQHALALARKSPPKPTNFRVGAVLVDIESNTATSTGYTLELEGNTHAEQCAFSKLAARLGVDEGAGLANAMAGKPHALYTTMEPCSVRLSGNKPCVERVMEQKSWVKRVLVGVVEPRDFVEGNDGRAKLEGEGVEVLHIGGLEEEILEVAKAGHVRLAEVAVAVQAEEMGMVAAVAGVVELRVRIAEEGLENVARLQTVDVVAPVADVEVEETAMVATEVAAEVASEVDIRVSAEIADVPAHLTALTTLGPALDPLVKKGPPRRDTNSLPSTPPFKCEHGVTAFH
ncbi:related to RIB2 - DRAP deaminase [Cephalotrichum gorgonifer]|uniref:Related to RIB2 - DRAP deaminase n=1 Tax=Cephalotrichum gorgonifer TaxID=2041049 RepID=A0AAE8SXN1_9PEZI|nr:related to RIB2 - DRAP deaminase [Cephalotrichum gorgonifer]